MTKKDHIINILKECHRGSGSKDDLERYADMILSYSPEPVVEGAGVNAALDMEVSTPFKRKFK